MTLTVKSVNGEPVIEGTAEHVERFSTALLAAAGHTDWLRANADHIVITDGARTVVYRITAGWGVLAVDWRDLPADDNTFIAAELVSDTARDGS